MLSSVVLLHLNDLLNLEAGHVLYMLSAVATTPTCSSFRTQFFITTGKCLLIHYRWRNSGLLSVLLRNEDRDIELLANITASQEQQNKWQMFFIELPDKKDLRQVVFRIYRIPGQLSGIIFDDLVVRSCTDFSK